MRHFIFTQPFPGCELDADEFGVVAPRYFGVECPACAPLVGQRIRAKGSEANGKKLDAYGKALVNTNVGEGLRTKRHNALLSHISAELEYINNYHKTGAYGIFEGRFGNGSERAQELAEAFFAGDERHRQGCVPDIYVEPHENAPYRVAEKSTLYELKQINLRQAYFQVFAWKDPCHAVHTRWPAAQRVRQEVTRC